MGVKVLGGEPSAFLSVI